MNDKTERPICRLCYGRRIGRHFSHDGLKLGRAEDAVRAKAGKENVSLKPINQSPYNRRKP